MQDAAIITTYGIINNQVFIFVRHVIRLKYYETLQINNGMSIEDIRCRYSLTLGNESLRRLFSKLGIKRRTAGNAIKQKYAGV